MNAPFVRSPYNYDIEAVSDQTGLSCTDSSRTQQQFRDESNVNHIMKKFGRAGVVPSYPRQDLGSEFIDIISYQDALNALNESAKEFMKLPAQTRRYFDNDPGKFVEFCSNEDNRDEAIRLGLVKKPVAPEPSLEGSPPSSSPPPAPSGG